MAADERAASATPLIAVPTTAQVPACTGIRKMIDFTLAPGPHLLQISEAEATRIGMLFALPR